MRLCKQNTYIAPDPIETEEIAIFLSEDEATELKLLLPESNFNGKLKDAPLSAKLHLALEMLGIGVELLPCDEELDGEDA